MAHRKFSAEKHINSLNFKLRPEIPFSISVPKVIVDDFELKVANENTDKSKKLVKFIFELLNKKNYQELNSLSRIKTAEKVYRDAIYKIFEEELKISKGDFSKFITEQKIIPYLNNGK